MHMYYNGDWLVTKYDGQPDLWNTKPPLVIWMQVLSMHIFGVNELGMRMPSALISLASLLLMLGFSIKFLKNGWIGLFAVIFTVCSNGFTDFHLSRTADYDAFVNFFLLAYALFFFAWIIDNQKRWLFYFFICLILSVMSKSVTGVFFLPGIFCYVLFSGHFIRVFTDRLLWTGIFSAFIIIAAYYLIRDHASQGYISAVWQNEIGGRYFTTLEGHDKPWSFFIEYLFKWSLPVTIIFFVVGLIWKFNGISIPQIYFKRYAIILLITLTIFLSIANTKLSHYISPLVPFMSFIAAYGLYAVSAALWNNHRIVRWRNWVLTLFLLLVFSLPVYRIVDYVMDMDKSHEGEKEFYALSEMLQNALYRNNQNLQGFKIVGPGYSAHLDLYLNELKRKGYKLDRIKKEEIQPGDLIAAADSDRQKYVESHFNIESAGDYGFVKLYKIMSYK